MNSLIKYFLRGLVIVIPIAVTIYVIVQLFVWIDRLLGLERTGVGFLIVMAGTTLVGLLASKHGWKGHPGKDYFPDQQLLKLHSNPH